MFYALLRIISYRPTNSSENNPEMVLRTRQILAI